MRNRPRLRRRIGERPNHKGRRQRPKWARPDADFWECLQTVDERLADGRSDPLHEVRWFARNIEDSPGALLAQGQDRLTILAYVIAVGRAASQCLQDEPTPSQPPPAEGSIVARLEEAIRDCADLARREFIIAGMHHLAELLDLFGERPRFRRAALEVARECGAIGREQLEAEEL